MISSQTSRVSYILSSGAQTLSVPFYFLDNTHIGVYKVTSTASTKLVLGVDYNATGAGVEAGGSITLTGTATAAADKVTIKRTVPATQLVDYAYNDNLPADTIEQGLDKLTMLVQMLIENDTRALHLVDGETLDGELAIATRKGKFIYFNATTGAVEFADGQDVLDAAAEAAASAAAALDSANQAATSANEAADSAAEAEAAVNGQPTTYETGIGAALASRAAVPVTTDIPDVTFSTGASVNPINGGAGSASQTYPFNTTAVQRGGAYLATNTVSSEDFQQNRVNGQTGSSAQPWWIEFDLYANDFAMRFVSNTISARIMMFVDGQPISQMAPDQTASITSGAASWVRYQWAGVKWRRIRLYLVACDFGGITVPTGYSIVANPKSEVRRAAFVGDSWGVESGRMKFPFTIPYLLGRMLEWEMAHCSVGGTGYINGTGSGTNFGGADRMTGITAFNPQFVFVSGSINDNSSSGAAIQSAAAAYYTAVAAALPSAKLIVVGPQPVGPGYESNAALLANNAAVKAAALAAANVLGFVDLIEGRVIRGNGGVTSSADTVGDGNYTQLIISEADLHPGVAGAWHIAQRILEGAYRLLEKNELIRSTAGANEFAVTEPSRNGEARTFTNLTNLGTTAIDGTKTCRWYQNIGNIALSTYIELTHSGGQWRFRENSTGGASRNVLNMAFGGCEIDFNAAPTSIGGMRISANTNTAGAVTQAIVSTHSNASGTNVSLAITPTFNQSSTGAATDFLINRTQTSLGSGNQRFIACQVAGVDRWYVRNDGLQVGPAFTVATLPATPPTGSRAYVTDATAPTYNGVLVGGGAVTVPVFYNGAAWVSA